MNVLFCSAGRRSELLKDFKLSMQPGSVIVAADHAKLGSSYFEIVARLPEIEAIVTDSDADETIVQELRAGGGISR